MIMTDLFDNPVLCKNCEIKMQKISLVKNGFTFRSLQCRTCGNRIVHPEDKQEYDHYLNLRKKDFNVKLRMVGNSYTVSIPKEIVNFINEQNKVMDDMVRLNLDRMNRLSLEFDKLYRKDKDER
tara:strand:- start:1678 stop:2049 length:372 start_codon:yes stop_codon:yes gene_type:complete